LHNTAIAAVIANRLVENSEICLLEGERLRKAQKASTSASRTRVGLFSGAAL
jgi:hypothetical protein